MSALDDALAELATLKAGGVPLDASDTPYNEWRTEFGGLSGFGAGAGVSLGVVEPPDYATSDTGKFLYPNGAIADPTTGDPLSGVRLPDDPNTPGSEAWILKIQDQWSDKEANKWRKTLSGQGYEVAESGGMAHDLLNALRLYHRYRYINGGKVQPLTPMGNGAISKKELKKSVDFVALKETIKPWTQVPFGDDMTDDEQDYFADLILQEAVELVKTKGWDAEGALQGAQARVKKQFEANPEVRQNIEEAEELEGDLSLRNSIVSISQLGAI